MAKIKNKIYVIVEKGTNRVISVVDDGMVDWYQKNLPIFDRVEIESSGSGTCNTKYGTISYLSWYTRDNQSYYMIEHFDERIGDINKAYEILSSD